MPLRTYSLYDVPNASMAARTDGMDWASCGTVRDQNVCSTLFLARRGLWARTVQPRSTKGLERVYGLKASDLNVEMTAVGDGDEESEGEEDADTIDKVVDSALSESGYAPRGYPRHSRFEIKHR